MYIPDQVLDPRLQSTCSVRTLSRPTCWIPNLPRDDFLFDFVHSSVSTIFFPFRSARHNDGYNREAFESVSSANRFKAFDDKQCSLVRCSHPKHSAAPVFGRNCGRFASVRRTRDPRRRTPKTGIRGGGRS